VKLLARLGLSDRAAAVVDRVGVLQPLRVRDFALLWTGMAVSFVGDGIYTIAIAWQTYDLSNSPSALAAVGIAWSSRRCPAAVQWSVRPARPAAPG
jgi:hypothetical protein